MTIPATVTAELQNLQSQVNQYTPIANAPHAGIVAMQLNAAQLVVDVQNALTINSSTIDNFSSAPNAPSIIIAVLNLAEVAHDQNSLSLMRGIVGRVASNLDQF